MCVAALLREVTASSVRQIRLAGQVPQGVTYQFLGGDGEAQAGTGVQKTRVRQVRSVRYGRFQAREVVLRPTGGAQGGVRSAELSQLVPAHANYAFDVVAGVGWASMVEGRPLKEVGQWLQELDGSLAIGASTLYDLKLRFLFYLEAMHQGAHGLLRQYLAGRGGYTALVDGTCEGGSPVLLGVTEAEEEMVLGSWKIATENAPDVETCLRALAEAVGRPKRGMHDQSSGIRLAWAAALPGVPDSLCLFHFGRDVGRDLCESKDKALRAEIRGQKLALRLDSQRKAQTDAIERAIAEKKAEPGVLQRLLVGEAIKPQERESLGRQVVIAFHQWILDYPHDGQGRGFPFDVRTLALHRRIVKAENCLRELVARLRGTEGIPDALYSLAARLCAYTANQGVVQAAAEYEEAWALFNRLRTVLRLETSGSIGSRPPRIAPLSDPCLLTAEEGREAAAGLVAFAAELRGEMAGVGGKPRAKLLQTIVTHLEEYAPHLQGPPSGEEGVWERTNNKRERQWRQTRRLLRRTHGRSNVGRDLCKLPAGLGLLPNLTNPVYEKVVLGRRENLADRFAAAASTAGSFAAWKQAQGPVRIGRLPLRDVRSEDLLEQVSAKYASELLGCAGVCT